jgi:hypothetical protein
VIVCAGFIGRAQLRILDDTDKIVIDIDKPTDASNLNSILQARRSLGRLDAVNQT